MRTFIGVGVAFAVVTSGLLACSSKAGGTTGVATGGTGAMGNASGQTTQVATDPHGRPVREPFHFQTRVHEPHLAPAVAPLPPLPAMPRFVDGAARCFPRAAEYPTRYGSGGYSQPATATSKPAKRPSSAPSPSSAYSFGSGDPLGAGAGTRAAAEHKAGAAADASAPASAPYKPAPAPAATSAQASPPPPAERREGEASRSRGDDKKEKDAYAANQPGYEPAPPAYGGRQPDWGSAIYLSNDDTMSLSSAQRIIWAIDHYSPVEQSHVRPHELLNYFSFQTQPVALDHDFSVLPNIAPSTEDPNLLTLSLAIQGRPLNQATRRNANLAYVIDRSGSMAAEGRMDYLKQGLLRSVRELKQGDIVHLVLFDDTSCDLAQNFVVGRDSLPRLEQMIRQIQPAGSTNLNDGLGQGYAAVDRTYQPGYSNRVIFITDAIANTGVTDEGLISMVGKHYDDRKVRLSGVGVGSDFNDSLLDSLTERGKGAYVFLGSEAEVDAVFGSRFISLIETIATDVHFRLHLPPSLAMQTFYGEEASTSKERVQAIHYFANTSQLFLSDLLPRDGALPTQDDILVSVEYQDAETGRARVEEFAWNLGQIAGRAPNIDKGMLVSRFARELGTMAERPLPSGYGERAASWADHDAAQRCYSVRADLERLGAGLTQDPEVQRVRGLWDKYCGRYVPVQPVYQPPVYRPQPVQPQPPTEWPTPTTPTTPPTRNNDYAPAGSWPSARQ